ncbi:MULTISPECIES: autotransporter domain-containing protein [unclassified Bradyrhizobium]|uniref:autotransporter domain-containing protein n=2 Tax=unclassified Bradyrhizobium TaxID=2631580 RepID=UPI0028EF1CAB|nr:MULTISPECIES: autotransporter domain-containing protein [unclassified Bradyrhizobium]
MRAAGFPLTLIILASAFLLPMLVADESRAQTGPFVFVPQDAFGISFTTMSTIDTSNNNVLTPLVTGAQPTAAVVRGDESIVYLSNSNSSFASPNTVYAIDTATNAIIATINVGGGANPLGISISPDNTRLYVANAAVNDIAVIDTTTNTVVATIPVGNRPTMTAVSPDGTRVYATNLFGNTVSVIDTATNSVTTTINVGVNPAGVTFSPDGTRAYVANQTSNTISVVDTATNAVLTNIGVAAGASPRQIAVSPDGTRLYVTNFNNDTVSVINAVTNTVITNIAVGTDPFGVVISPDGSRVYVTNRTSNNVSVIDTASNTVLTTLAVSSSPGIASNCSNGNALLAAGLTFKANTSGALACTLASGPSGASGPIFTGGTLQFAAGGISTSLPITLLSQGGTFDTAGNNATLSGTISGPGGFTKIGAGTLTLSGAGTYSGPTFVNAGTLQAGIVNAFSPNSAYTIASGATVDLGSFNQSIGSLAGSGSVTLGSATLTTGNNGTSTAFGGVISGTGRLTKIGAGAFTLSGSNTYSGGTAVNAGTLVIGNNSALGTGLLSLAAGTTLSFLDTANFTIANNIQISGDPFFTPPAGTTQTISSVISDGTIAGTLDMSGAGTLVLTGNNTYTGATSINSGILVVDGSIAPSASTINGGGTLAGSGTVGNVMVGSGGILAPGPLTSPGSMTIAGNLAFQAGAFYLVQTNSTASLANVSGIATLTGGTVLASGLFTQDRYHILHANGGLGGTTFAGAITSSPTVSATLSYTGTDVFLDLVAQLTNLSSTVGLSVNQFNVASAVDDFFNSGGVLPPRFAELFALNPAALKSTLTQLSGEAATGAQQGAFQLGGQFLNVMLDPFVDGRGGTAGMTGPAFGFAPEREALPDDVAFAYAKAMKAPMATKAPPLLSATQPLWTAWGTAYGGSNNTNGNPVIGSHDLSARVAGFAGGLDYHVMRDTVLGFAFAGGATNWSLAQGLGGGRSDAFQAGAYAVTRSGPAYLAASAAFTNHWISTDRFAAFADHLTANFNAQSFGARVEGGYRFGLGAFGVSPYAALQAQAFRTPTYSEADLSLGGFGLSGLSYNGRTATDTRSELGARFDYIAAVMPDAVITLRSRLGWAHDWVSDPSLTALFQSLPGASFVVNGASPAKDSALVSAGAEFRLANGISLLAKFDGEFAGHAQTYAGTGTVRYSW